MVIIEIYALPKAAKNQIIGFNQDGSLKIKLNAVPENGQANQELMEFLSKILSVKKQSIAIKSGHSSRHKIIEIDNLELDDFKAKINKLQLQ